MMTEKGGEGFPSYSFDNSVAGTIVMLTIVHVHQASYCDLNCCYCGSHPQPNVHIQDSKTVESPNTIDK